MRRYGFPGSASVADGATPAHRPIPLTRSAEPTKPTVTRKIDMLRAYRRTPGVRSHTPGDRMKVGQSLMRAMGFAMASAVGVCAFAQDYPARPVRMIVGFPPGGATDLVARIIQQKMTETLGQQVVVDNRPGA